MKHGVRCEPCIFCTACKDTKIVKNGQMKIEGGMPFDMLILEQFYLALA